MYACMYVCICVCMFICVYIYACRYYKERYLCVYDVSICYVYEVECLRSSREIEMNFSLFLPSTSTCTVRISKIPYTAMAEDLVEFLNTSISSNTVFACKIHTEKMNWKSKGYGFVQFETEGDAKKAVELAKKCRLKFEGSMLEVEFEAKEIVSRPQITVQCKSLYVGCLTNPTILCVLWSSKREVTLELDCKKGKLALIVDILDSGAKYKLTWKLKSLDISGTDREKNLKDNFVLLQV